MGDGLDRSGEWAGGPWGCCHPGQGDRTRIHSGGWRADDRHGGFFALETSNRSAREPVGGDHVQPRCPWSGRALLPPPPRKTQGATCQELARSDCREIKMKTINVS